MGWLLLTLPLLFFYVPTYNSKKFLLGIHFLTFLLLQSFCKSCEFKRHKIGATRQVSLHDELRLSILEEEEEEEEEVASPRLTSRATQTTAFYLGTSLVTPLSERTPPPPPKVVTPATRPPAESPPTSYREIFKEIFLVLSRAKSSSSSQIPPV